MAKKKDEVKLPRSGVENYSCGRGASCRGVGVVKARDCIWVKDVTLTGDAPKGFVRLYEFQRDGRTRRRNPSTWPLYIAKTGHKWYPVESITEHLLNRLGTVFGIEQANLSRDLFTLQFVERAVTKAFPKERDAILGDLVRLLLFDAMVGNNDRHFPFNA